jgi:hypothetical protein
VSLYILRQALRWASVGGIVLSIRELLLLAQHGGKGMELPLNGDAAQSWRTGDGAYKVLKKK